MHGALVRLFPAWWRRRHGADYRALLEQTPLTLGSLLGVLTAAIRAHARPPSRLGGGWASVLTLGTLVLLLCFFAGWSGIYRHSAFDVEWRVVQFAALGYAASGVFLTRRGHRVVGTGTVVAALVALAWQMALGVPGWRAADLPLRLSLLWFMGLSCWCAWWATFGGRSAATVTSSG